MENYLLDGRCSISNNAAENAIRPFTVGRERWLFTVIGELSVGEYCPLMYRTEKTRKTP